MNALIVQHVKAMRRVEVTFGGGKRAIRHPPSWTEILDAFSLLRHCVQLRSLNLDNYHPDPRVELQMQLHVARVIHRNAAHFAELRDEEGTFHCLPVLAALSACSKLARFEGNGIHCHDDLYATAVQRVFSANRGIVNARLDVDSGCRSLGSRLWHHDVLLMCRGLSRDTVSDQHLPERWVRRCLSGRMPTRSNVGLRGSAGAA
jgi:hypothetical protein